MKLLSLSWILSSQVWSHHIYYWSLTLVHKLLRPKWPKSWINTPTKTFASDRCTFINQRFRFRGEMKRRSVSHIRPCALCEMCHCSSQPPSDTNQRRSFIRLSWRLDVTTVLRLGCFSLLSHILWQSVERAACLSGAMPPTVMAAQQHCVAALIVLSATFPVSVHVGH